MKEALLVGGGQEESKALEEKLDINGINRVNTLFSGSY